MLERVDLQRHAPFKGLAAGLAGEWHLFCVGDHVLAYMSHRVEFLLTDLTSVLLLGVAMNDFIMLMKRPQLSKGFSTSQTLNALLAVSLLMQQ